MKYLLAVCLFFTAHVMADIHATDVIEVTPKAERVEAARACFSELQTLGCGHPKDDLKHFRSCMNEVYSTLDQGCQKIMKRLYGN